jgi:hypothetical protein
MSSSMADSPVLPAQPPQPLEDGGRPPALHIQPRPSGRPPGSVADPDPHVFVPPGSGSISQRYGSFYHSAKMVRKTLISTVL